MSLPSRRDSPSRAPSRHKCRQQVRPAHNEEHPRARAQPTCMRRSHSCRCCCCFLFFSFFSAMLCTFEWHVQ